MILATGTAYFVGHLITIENNFVALFVKGSVGVVLFVSMALILRVFNRHEINAFVELIRVAVRRGVRRS